MNEQLGVRRRRDWTSCVSMLNRIRISDVQRLLRMTTCFLSGVVTGVAAMDLDVSGAAASK
jgi:hypothetical protein